MAAKKKSVLAAAFAGLFIASLVLLVLAEPAAADGVAGEWPGINCQLAEVLLIIFILLVALKLLSTRAIQDQCIYVVLFSSCSSTAAMSVQQTFSGGSVADHHDVACRSGPCIHCTAASTVNAFHMQQ
jgi:hypothetical protein